MSINIQFSDFDTVCYSIQHNLIQLIKNAVGLSIEVNINADNIAGLQVNVRTLTTQVNKLNSDIEDVSEKAQEGHDALLLGQNLNQRLSALEGAVGHIENYDDTFINFTELGYTIKHMDTDLSKVWTAITKNTDWLN